MIYFIKSDLSAAVKIGFSQDPKKRARALSLPGCRVLASIPGDKAKEKALHERFAHLRIGQSEWYRNEEPLTGFVEGLQGEPSAGMVGQAVDTVLEQIDRLASLLALVLLLAGCSPSEAKSGWAFAWLAFVGLLVFFWLAAVFYLKCFPKPEPILFLTKAGQRQRLVFTGTLQDPELGTVLLAGDPGNVERTTARDRLGNVVSLQERILPHIVYIPGTGACYNLQSGVTEIDERLARPGQVARVLKAAQGWPRVANEPEPLPALEGPDVVEGDWLPVLSEYKEVAQDE